MAADLKEGFGIELVKRLVLPMVEARSREPGDAWHQAADAILNLIRERDEAVARADRADEQVMAQRDSYHEWADRLAYAIGGSQIGEHSSINNPWQNAIELAEELHVRAEAAQAPAAPEDSTR